MNFDSDIYDFNPRPPRGGRQQVRLPYPAPKPISIHAPREGGDLGAEHDLCPLLHISIHAPREGGDDVIRAYPSLYEVFQSTPPARGATFSTPTVMPGGIFQSTPPARGATPRSVPPSIRYSQTISIHAPREGGDHRNTPEVLCRLYFNPRPPRGGRPAGKLVRSASYNFNPRPPRGGRLRLFCLCDILT